MENKQHLLHSERVDWDVINELQSLDGALAEIVAVFETELPQKLQQIENMIKVKNPEEAVKGAHSLRSSSSYLGALQIKQLCDDIRNQVSISNWDEAQLIFEKLKEESYILVNLLQEKLK